MFNHVISSKIAFHSVKILHPLWGCAQYVLNALNIQNIGYRVGGGGRGTRLTFKI